MLRTIVTLAILLLTVAGCARYQPHDGKTPQGYYHQQLDSETLKVGYETWRPAKREKVCGLARRRLGEIAADYHVQEENWSQQIVRAQVQTQTALVRATGSGDFGSGSDMISAGYVDERLIRRCELIAVKPVAGD